MRQRLIPAHRGLSSFQSRTQSFVSARSQASAQAARLLQSIAPATFAELQVEPRAGWRCCLSVLGGFCNHSLKRYANDSARYELERRGSTHFPHEDRIETHRIEWGIET